MNLKIKNFIRHCESAIGGRSNLEKYIGIEIAASSASGEFLAMTINPADEYK